MTDFEAARTAMVDRQIRPSDVTSFPIIEAMLAVPRERFAPMDAKAVAYADAPLAQGGGRFALPPMLFAKLLDGAQIGPEDFVLDVAPGLGYSTAVIARICGAVIGVEPDAALATAASETLAALEIDNAMVKEGAAEAGDAPHGPYDAIFVNGGVAGTPKALLDQLKDGGRLVAVAMDGASGRAVVWLKTGEVATDRRLFDATAAIAPGFERAAEFAL